MAEFTIQLRTLLQTDFQPALDDYPIFDETYRGILNAKILKHYYMEEIGLETPDLFNHYLDMRMGEIMPYYNEMYQVQALIVNPFHNFEYSETSKRETDGTTKEDATGNTTDQSTGNTTENTEQGASTKFTKGQVRSHSAQSDTPQSNLTPYNVATGGYASLVNMSETESDEDQTITDTTTDTTATNTLSSTGTSTLSSTGTAVNKRTGTNKTVDDYIRTISGSQGVSKPEILKQHKSAFINIDREIINELRDLFMIVY